MKDIEKISSQFTELMIKKISKMESNHYEPWLKVDGTPRNIRGTAYHGINLLMLLLDRELKGYKYPVYLTINQANENGLKVSKGEKGMIVFFFKKYVRSQITGRSIKYEEYLLLTEEEAAKYRVLPRLKMYYVFNVEQTNIRISNPDLWNSFSNASSLSNSKMKCESIDAMVENQTWLCDILISPNLQPAYSIVEDKITCPPKTSFIEERLFYSTLLHEIAHSTGSKERLNRDFSVMSYAREELIAELTGAILCAYLGLATTPQKQEASYLKGWLKSINEEPDYLQSIISDVGKACNMINSVLYLEKS